MLSEENKRLIEHVFAGWVLDIESWIIGELNLNTLLDAARAEERSKVEVAASSEACATIAPREAIPSSGEVAGLVEEIEALKADLQPFAHRILGSVRIDMADVQTILDAFALLSLLREGKGEEDLQTVSDAQCGVGPSDMTDQQHRVSSAEGESE